MIAHLGLRIADLGLFGPEATEDVKHEEALRAVGSFGKSAEGMGVMLQAAWAKGMARKRGGDEVVLGGFVSRIRGACGETKVAPAEKQKFFGGANAFGVDGCGFGGGENRVETVSFSCLFRARIVPQSRLGVLGR